MSVVGMSYSGMFLDMFFFFFKQKTAYEMRISDWSSDVCSSDLARLDDTRREAQREVNALAARMGELQAEANRLNALGERLTRIGQLGDGEFDFDKPVGIGGEGPVRDMAAGTLRSGMGELGMQLADRSEEHTSELQSLMRISYAV